MIRKLLMVAAVAIVPVGAVMATGVPAGAVTPPTATATCGTITGTLSFSPPISNAGTSVAPGGTFVETTTVKGTLGGCTTTAAGVKITKGVVLGTAKLTTHNTKTVAIKAGTCAGLSGVNPAVVKLTTTWTATPAVPPTVSNFTNDKGATVGTPTHASFTLPGSVTGNAAGTGSFLGTNSGKSDKSSAKTVLTVAAMLTLCKNPVSSLAITTNTAPAASFG